MLLVGISGRKASGKDTLVTALRERLRWKYQTDQLAFADELKNHCINLFGLTEEQCFGSGKNDLTDISWNTWPYTRMTDYHENEFMRVREVLQGYGALMRRINPNCWINICLDYAKESWAEVVFITDVRYPNEVAAIQKLGGKVIRLTRGDHNDRHISETALDGFPGFDYILYNSRITKESQVLEGLAVLGRWL